MFHDRSQSSKDVEPSAKRSRQSHTADESTAQSSSHSAESSSTDRADVPPPRNVISLLTYPFLLPLVVVFMSYRDVVARLLMINKSIRLMTPKYGLKQMLLTPKALRVIRASRDITFSVTRIESRTDDIQQLVDVQRENSTPLKEVIWGMSSQNATDPTYIIPRFVTHVIHSGGRRIPVPVGSIPDSVVELDLSTSVPVVGSIPSSVKRLSMITHLSDLDPAVIPSTVTYLRLIQLPTHSYQPHPPWREILFQFPSSLTHLCLRSYNLPIAPGIIPPSVVMLKCCSELLSKLEVGSIPNSVKQTKTQWNMSDIPRAGVIPDSVTHIDIDSNIALPEDIPHWHMPAHLTHLKISILKAAHRWITVGFVPGTVTHFKSTCQAKPGALPNSITHLEMGISSELVAGMIPRSVTHLNLLRTLWQKPAIFGPGAIPSSITHLAFCCNGKQKMTAGIIPHSVTHLTFDSLFNRPIPGGAIPPSVTHLVFGGNFNQRLNRRSLPYTLTHLALGNGFLQEIGASVIPPSVRHLVVDRSFTYVFENDVIEVIPFVTHLTTRNESNQNLDHSNLPRSLTHLNIPLEYLTNQKLQLPASVTHLSYQPLSLSINQQPEFRSNFWHFQSHHVLE